MTHLENVLQDSVILEVRMCWCLGMNICMFHHLGTPEQNTELVHHIVLVSLKAGHSLDSISLFYYLWHLFPVHLIVHSLFFFPTEHIVFYVFVPLWTAGELCFFGCYKICGSRFSNVIKVSVKLGFITRTACVEMSVLYWNIFELKFHALAAPLLI